MIVIVVVVVVVFIIDRRFGIKCQFHLEGFLTLEDGTDVLCRNVGVGKEFHYTLYNNPEDCISDLHRDRSLKSCT